MIDAYEILKPLSVFMLADLLGDVFGKKRANDIIDDYSRYAGHHGFRVFVMSRLTREEQYILVTSARVRGLI